MPKLKEVSSRGEQDLPAYGDNSGKLLVDYVERYTKKLEAVEAIRGEMKDILNEAKNDGFLKTAIRKTVKNLRLTEEQRQAKQEIDEATRHYTELCQDLPLFSAAA